jgi:hypothetical protein
MESKYITYDGFPAEGTAHGIIAYFLGTLDSIIEGYEIRIDPGLITGKVVFKEDSEYKEVFYKLLNVLETEEATKHLKVDLSVEFKNNA